MQAAGGVITGLSDGLSLRPGSPCDNFQGYCDVFLKCRKVDAEGPLARLKNLLFNQVSANNRFLKIDSNVLNVTFFAGNSSHDSTMGDGVLVGCTPHGNCFRYIYGNIYSVLCHPHALIKSQIAKELALYRDAQKTCEILAAKGKTKYLLRSISSSLNACFVKGKFFDT